MEEDYENDEDLPISKSQINRDLNDLKVLGKHLITLPDKKFIDIPVSEKTREAIVAARTMKHGALARQLKFIGSLMQEEDKLSIRSALEKSKKPDRDEVKKLHQFEQWRDNLLQGDQDLFNELLSKFEGFDRQHVNQLIRNAKKEHKLSKPPKSSRLLFKYLSELQES
jgi:ribosome-associated protein